MSKDQIGDMTPKFYGGRTKTDIEKSLEAEIQQLKAGLARAVNILRWIDAENGKVECACDVSVGYYCQPCCIKREISDPLGAQAYEEVQQLKADNQELKDILDGKDAEIKQLYQNQKISGGTWFRNLTAEKEVLEKRVKELELLLNPANLTVFAILDSENIKKEQVWPFLVAAGQGCISGAVDNWPQLKPSLRWAREYIVALEAKLEKAMKVVEAAQESDCCVTYDMTHTCGKKELNKALLAFKQEGEE